MDKLPQEILDMIIARLADRGERLSPFSTISSRWKRGVERVTFRELHFMREYAIKKRNRGDPFRFPSNRTLSNGRILMGGRLSYLRKIAVGVRLEDRNQDWGTGFPPGLSAFLHHVDCLGQVLKMINKTAKVCLPPTILKTVPHSLALY